MNSNDLVGGRFYPPPPSIADQVNPIYTWISSSIYLPGQAKLARNQNSKIPGSLVHQVHFEFETPNTFK